MQIMKDIWQRSTINFRIYTYLRQLMKEARLPAEEVRKLQFTRLKKLLCDVYQTHPFYQERFDASLFDPFKMADISELKNVPVLEKEDYRGLVKNLVEEKGEKHFQNWYEDSTSGSTGIPMHVLRTWDERAYMLAKWMRVLFLNGYKWRDVTFSLSIPTHIQRDSFVQRFGILKRYTGAWTDPIENQVELYIKSKPSVVFGNKAYLVQLALYCNQNNIKLPRPYLCVSYAEKLDGPSRSVLEKCFGTDCLMEIYGAIEVSIIAWQMKGDDFFNICHTTDILEVLDENGQDTDRGGSILTDLFIRSFPLIRYNLGDVLNTGIINGLPVINEIRGRQDDKIIFADGGTVPWPQFAIILEKRRHLLKQFRVIQEDYDLIRIVIAKEEEADKSAVENVIIDDLRKEMRNERMEYIVDFVDRIPTDPNGKIRSLISKVS
jgi:phenylacetate-coenzyme A ligase PaaK-like adenylate-forming protein